MMLINALIPPMGWGKMKMVALVRPKDNKESLDNLLFAILYLFYLRDRRLCK